MGPNGASMRPLGPNQLDLVQGYRGKHVMVYAIPEGTELPDDLVLVHENDDHYSLQPGKKMDFEVYQGMVSQFLKEKGTIYTREEWLQTYQESAKQVGQAGPFEQAEQPEFTQAGSSDWVYDQNTGYHYRYDEEGTAFLLIENKEYMRDEKSEEYYRYDEDGSVVWLIGGKEVRAKETSQDKGKQKGRAGRSRR